MSRDILFALIGAAAMFLIMRILASSMVTGNTSKAVIDLLKTQQAANLILTNEFRELAKTNQFKTLAKTLAANEINALSNAMTSRKF
jgi:hypothetical protein